VCFSVYNFFAVQHGDRKRNEDTHRCSEGNTFERVNTFVRQTDKM